jgi:predicted metal-dependent phosphoesterase TrpH
MVNIIPNQSGYRVDFHCHTSFSRDSLTTPKALVECCLRKGLGRVVVTDHNTIDGALEAYHLDPIHVIVGEEIMTTCGELLAAFVKEKIPAGLSPRASIQLLREQEAFISVSHPFDKYRNGSWSLENLIPIFPLVDAIEGFNARCMWREANSQAKSFAGSHDMAMTAGSDAHAAFELGVATVWLQPFENADDLRKKIHQGRITARQSAWWVHLVSSYAKHHKATSRLESPGEPHNRG